MKAKAEATMVVRCSVALLLCLALLHGALAQYEEQTEEISNPYEEPTEPPAEESTEAPETSETMESGEDRPAERFEECYDNSGKPKYCTPTMINVAHHSKVDATETCHGDEEYCLPIDLPSANSKFSRIRVSADTFMLVNRCKLRVTSCKFEAILYFIIFVLLFSFIRSGSAVFEMRRQVRYLQGYRLQQPYGWSIRRAGSQRLVAQ